jgi:hypothetical protein
MIRECFRGPGVHIDSPGSALGGKYKAVDNWGKIQPLDTCGSNGWRSSRVNELPVKNFLKLVRGDDGQDIAEYAVMLAVILFRS